MTLYAKYTKPQNGYPYNKEVNQKYLTLDKIYEVDHVSMGQSMTHIYLVDFPGQHFNSVNFDFYHDDIKIRLQDFPEYNPYYYFNELGNGFDGEEDDL